MQTAFDTATLDEIVSAHGAQRSQIIAILQSVQEKYRYVPRECFAYLADALGISEAGIYSVATFYENFSLEPKGKFVLKVCDGTACHVRSSIPILERLRKDLGLSDSKHTTDDNLFTLETVSCLGACGLAPVLTLNDHVHPSMTPDKASQLIQEIKAAEATAQEGEANA